VKQEQSDDVLSISRRAYVITKSLSELKASIFGVLLLLLVIIFFMGIDVYNPGPIIFLPWHVALDNKTYFIIMFIVTSVGLIWYVRKDKQLERNLNDWKEDYLEQAYILVFDTILPNGDTTGEKILNLAMAVFPELRPNYIPPSLRDRIKLHFKRKLDKPQHIIVSESMNYKVSPEYSVDLALRIPDGYFIVKDFKDKVVSIEELKYLVKILSHKFTDVHNIPTFLATPGIFRLICVAKAYDEPFLNRETLEKLMTEDLKASFKIDLIIEERVGYSVLWTS
jgi:hypothetical protein